MHLPDCINKSHNSINPSRRQVSYLKPAQRPKTIKPQVYFYSLISLIARPNLKIPQPPSMFHAYFEYREFVTLSVAKEPGRSPTNRNQISPLSFGAAPRFLRYTQDDKPMIHGICTAWARRSGQTHERPTG